MPATTVRRAIPLVLLVIVLATAWPSSAAGAQLPSAFSIQSGDFRIPEFFDRFLTFLQRFNAKDGCHIDPNGRCAQSQAPESQRKDGCHIDPDGRCRT